MAIKKTVSVEPKVDIRLVSEQEAKRIRADDEIPCMEDFRVLVEKMLDALNACKAKCMASESKAEMLDIMQTEIPPLMEQVMGLRNYCVKLIGVRGLEDQLSESLQEQALDAVMEMHEAFHEHQARSAKRKHGGH